MMSVANASTCNSEERKVIAEWWRQDDRRLFGTDVVEAAIENGAYEHQFALVLRDDQGSLVGRVNGRCSLGLARIDGLIVEARERGSGYGATLLAAQRPRVMASGPFVLADRLSATARS